jgi:hypothetical protein
MVRPLVEIGALLFDGPAVDAALTGAAFVGVAVGAAVVGAGVVGAGVVGAGVVGAGVIEVGAVLDERDIGTAVPGGCTVGVDAKIGEAVCTVTGRAALVGCGRAVPVALGFFVVVGVFFPMVVVVPRVAVGARVVVVGRGVVGRGVVARGVVVNWIVVAVDDVAIVLLLFGTRVALMTMGGAVGVVIESVALLVVGVFADVDRVVSVGAEAVCVL